MQTHIIEHYRKLSCDLHSTRLLKQIRTKKIKIKNLQKSMSEINQKGENKKLNSVRTENFFGQ